MNSTAAINAYTKVDKESAIIGADPHELISMLFQGGLRAIAEAKSGIRRNETAAKGKSISRAIAIIGDGLNASLDKRVGGDLAEDLSSLYSYMVGRLVAANQWNDTVALDEVTRLLTELADAWSHIRPEAMRIMQPPKNSHDLNKAYAKA